MHDINGIKDRNHMIISVDTEKAFDKTKQPFMIKVTERLEMKVPYTNIIKVVYDKPIVNRMLDRGKLKAVPLRPGTRQACPLSNPIQYIRYLKA